MLFAMTVLSAILRVVRVSAGMTRGKNDSY
jgi:hypothetical protein